MFSTNRGTRRSPADYYPTPAWAVRAILDRLGGKLAGGAWLEPSAGRGHLLRTARDWYAERMPDAAPTWSAVELRPECEADLVELTDDVVIGDFLDTARMRTSYAGSRAKWEELLRRPDDVTLLCYCRTVARCHRRVLVRLLIAAGERLGVEVIDAGERQM